MLADVTRDHTRIGVEAAAGRQTHNEPNGFPFVEIFLGEDQRQRLNGQSQNEADNGQ